jgi:hypothetical protein
MSMAIASFMQMGVGFTLCALLNAGPILFGLGFCAPKAIGKKPKENVRELGKENCIPRGKYWTF